MILHCCPICKRIPVIKTEIVDYVDKNSYKVQFTILCKQKDHTVSYGPNFGLNGLVINWNSLFNKKDSFFKKLRKFFNFDDAMVIDTHSQDYFTSTKIQAKIDPHLGILKRPNPIIAEDVIKCKFS